MGYEKDGIDEFYDASTRALGMSDRATDSKYCEPCRLIHAVELPCAVVKARVHALIVEIGDVMDEEEIGDLDRPAFLSALRLRGISLEPQGPNWLAVSTVEAVPVHVEEEDTEPLAGRPL
jgi:hypothetical protein